MTLREVRIADLDLEPIGRTRPRLNQERVAHYEAHLDQAEPVTVFRIHGHLLLADGYHRLEAARRLGRTEVRADVRDGELSDALRFAVDHAREQRGISEAEAMDAIARRARKDR
ncbi:MAG TPA: ParB/RepB/Spo0J family partition protein [Sinomonas sp.]|nr:ParB/RepB/Spo0J family partition protein [Sinomonas sp.]